MIRIVPIAWLLVCAAPLLGSSSEADIAETLDGLHAQVVLKVVGGKVSVDHVHADTPSRQLLTVLKKLKNLQSLELYDIDNQEAAASLFGSSALTGLKKLKLSGSNVDDVVVLSLASLTNVESLSLIDVTVGKRGLRALSGMRNLKRLELSNLVEINRDAAAEIAKVESLEYFQPYGQYAPGALSLLHALSKLKHVAVGGLGINAKLTELKGIPTIERITIFRAEIDQVTADILGQLTHLKWVEFESCNLTPEAVIGVRALRLNVLKCSGMRIPIINDLTKGMPDNIRGSFEIGH